MLKHNVDFAGLTWNCFPLTKVADFETIGFRSRSIILLIHVGKCKLTDKLRHDIYTPFYESLQKFVFAAYCNKSATSYEKVVDNRLRVSTGKKSPTNNNFLLRTTLLQANKK